MTMETKRDGETDRRQPRRDRAGPQRVLSCLRAQETDDGERSQRHEQDESEGTHVRQPREERDDGEQRVIAAGADHGEDEDDDERQS